MGVPPTTPSSVAIVAVAAVNPSASRSSRSVPSWDKPCAPPLPTSATTGTARNRRKHEPMSAVTTVATPDVPRCHGRSVTSLLGRPVLLLLPRSPLVVAGATHLRPVDRVADRGDAWRRTCQSHDGPLTRAKRASCALQSLRVQGRRNARSHKDGRIQCIELRGVQNALSIRREKVGKKMYSSRLV